MIRALTNWMIGDPPNHLTQKERDWLIFKRKLMGYAAVAILTFGYNAAAHPSYAVPGTMESSTKQNTPFTVMTSLAAGVAWPLYWTWEGFAQFIEPDASPAETTKGDKA